MYGYPWPFDRRFRRDAVVGLGLGGVCLVVWAAVLRGVRGPVASRQFLVVGGVVLVGFALVGAVLRQQIRSRTGSQPVTLATWVTLSRGVLGAVFAGLVAAVGFDGAGAVTWLGDGSLRGWVGQLRHLRVRPRWYLAGVGMMLLGTEFETLVALALGGDVSVPAAPLPQYVLLFGVTLVFAGALEELGWRGFLQPRLQQRYSAVGSSVAIGVLWAVWHAPMILAGLGNFTAFWEYTLTIVAVSVIFGWLYNNTDAALPVVMVAHASHNLPPIGLPTSGVPAVFATVSGDTVFYLICAVSVVAYTSARTLTRDGTVPNVPGRVERRSSRPES